MKTRATKIIIVLVTPVTVLYAGAVHVVESTFATEQRTFFDGNTAVNGAGGGVYCSKAVATFNGSSFTENSAVWGGGEYLHSSFKRVA